MTETIICAIISGGLALIGVIITSKTTANKIQKQLEISQAVTETKIEELTREVREHNNFARRVPVVENESKHSEGDIKALEHYHEECP